jgi:uncharacterized protein YaaW (UPF0174 family)
MSEITDIRGMRTDVLHLNAELRTMSHLVVDGNLSLRDFLVLARLLFGGNPEMASMLANIQLFIALMGTARALTRALQIEMGPVGWAILGVSTAAGIAMTMIYETRGT